MILSEIVENAERSYNELSSQPSDQNVFNALNALGNLLCAVSPAASASSKGASLATRIEAASSSPDGRRDVAIFLIRALGHPELRSAIERLGGDHVERKITTLAEAAVPDILGYLNYGSFKLTHEKIDALGSTTQKAKELLEIFETLPRSPTEFVARRQEIFKRLSHALLKSFLNPFGYSEFTNTIRELTNSIAELLAVTDSSFSTKLMAASAQTEALITKAQESPTFLTGGTLLKFAEAAREALSRIEKESTERFRCTLQPRKPSPYTLERRYPLSESGRIVRVKVPIVNLGPGVANDCWAQVVCGNSDVIVGVDRVDIGTILPGEFALTFDALVGSPTAKLSFCIEIGWKSIKSADLQKVEFDVVAIAQKSDIDWNALEQSDPYSTDIAQGHEFVGRTRKVLALSNRFAKGKMQSSYITGQKRVGKTSLAFAVQDKLQTLDTPAKYEFIYLEYGDYAGANADATVQALGKAIADRLAPYFPMGASPISLDFRGTLAPLNQLAQFLDKHEPDLKLILVLDEFDEIHPEMYRFGPLAEAFFSNIRTLSAKKNIGMLLVGGENMPFIMNSQGDQLNKFVREPLDYFSRTEEWDDFVELVSQAKQTVTPLNWHESAVTELFNFTHGHPYFTKLLCAKIFQTAVADRDAEITTDEVNAAVAAVVETLDVNAFAHFWKDGIPLSREEAEVTEMKRRRCLVAIARTLRLKQPVTLEAIVTNRPAHAALAASEVPALVQDFVRRDIIQERGGKFEFTIPLFRHWLVEKGLTQLSSDTLGEELSAAIQAEEDRAYVTAGELVELTERWPLYRGRRISTDDIRGWLEQRKSFRDQRLLFTMLKNIRFVTEEEVREKLRTAHSTVKRYTSAFIPETRSQRRSDIVVTYVDGPGKSGSKYAEKYAEENLISSQCVLDPGTFEKSALDLERKNTKISGVVIVDDIAATGKGISENLRAFLKEHAQFLRDRSITVVVIVMLATKMADTAIRKAMQEYAHKTVDFRICEVLSGQHFAFSDENSIWSSRDDEDRAKALAMEIGSKIVRSEPLGFGNLALLAAFFDGCPNNSLPILHTSLGDVWKALLPRAKN